MIYFELCGEKPEGLQEKATQAWDQSAYVWRAAYGSSHDASDHTHLGYFGLVPLDLLTQRGYWWFELGDGRPSREVMREAKEMFSRLNDLLGWETYAHTEVKNPAAYRFARAFGFRYLGTANNTTYLGRTA